MSKKVITLKYFKQTALYLAFGLLLASCGGQSAQDQGTPTASNTQSVRGLAIDGYLARARVYMDYDNNRARAAWEPFAFTDNDGYFSFNPITNTDYCSSNISTELSIHCLRNTRDATNPVIRVDGGYDIMTGEPFYGQISRRADTLTQQIVISPVSTLLTNVIDKNDQQKVLDTLQISSSDLNIDYLNHENHINSHIFNLNTKLHKIISVVASHTQTTYSEIGSKANGESDLTGSAYQHLAESLIKTPDTLDNTISNADEMIKITHEVERDAKRFYNRWDLEIPTIERHQPTIIAEHVRSVANLVNLVLPANTESQTREDVLGNTRLVEALTVKSLHDETRENEFNNFSQIVLANENSSIRTTLIETLNSREADLNNLIRQPTLPESNQNLQHWRDISSLPIHTQSFSALAGKKIKVSDMNLGDAPNNLKDSEVEIYFLEGASRNEGQFKACVKYIDEANTDGTLGEGNTKGELVSGQWSLLNPNSLGESYSVILIIEFMGAKYQGIFKAAGQAEFNGVKMERIRFDQAGELREWLSTGLSAIEAIPESHQSCRTRLPSRVGL